MRAKVATLALALAAMLTLASASADAWQSAKLRAWLKPERLGSRTTIVFAFRIVPHGQAVPSAVTSMSLSYPANLGLVTSGLGLETCAAQQLELQGRCPANSLMGYGDALMEMQVGPEVIQEQGKITTWMAPVQEGHLAMLFYAEGTSPALAYLIFTGQILPAPTPYGGQLATTIPVIETFPLGADASVIQMSSTIGPMNVTYYSRYHGKRFPYHPNGLRLPDTCPRGGFPFAATFTFQDATKTTATTTVPCPHHRGHG